MAKYSFYPFVRQGFSPLLTDEDNYTGSPASPAGLRASVALSLTLDKKDPAGNTGSSAIAQTVTLKGPADVRGINPNAVVKAAPADWTTNFEPNYLPYIEFYDEDFLWRYTPAKEKQESGNNKFRLRPWITLVVLKDGEYHDDAYNGILPSITLTVDPNTVFPSQSQLWAWAHVHVNADVSNANINTSLSNLKSTLAGNADLAVSRLVSPRRLQANTGYHVFLVPTFETGRLAGIGMEIPSTVHLLDGAWQSGRSSDNNNWQFPVYYSWYFKTGAAGDFESLVRLLQPRVLDSSVGKRAMDLQKSNNPELEAVTTFPNDNPLLNLQGVLQPTGAVADTWDLAGDYSEAIRDIVNYPNEVLTQTGAGDPVIAPPIYGRWHAEENEVAAVSGTPDWLQETNLDPRYRVFAGAGAEVVRQHQDEYMLAAWEQIGDVMEANKKIRQLQLIKQVNKATYNRHLVPLAQEMLVDVSGVAHGRLRNLSDGYTVYKDINDSILSNTFFSGAFRRLTRPEGPLISNISVQVGNTVTTGQFITDINSGNAAVTGPYTQPAGQNPYNVFTPGQLTSGFIYSLPQVSNFGFQPAGVSGSAPVAGANSPATQAFIDAIAQSYDLLNSLPDYTFNTNPSLDIPTTGNVILTRTEPYTNALDMANNVVRLHNLLGSGTTALTSVDQVMAFPKIKKALFEDLAALSPDWMMPGLNNIEMNSVNLLDTNRKYVEAFMLGANYEMGRELLWQGYPTDQRGTYFSYFWGYDSSIDPTTFGPAGGTTDIYDLDDYRDIKDIVSWKSGSALSALGANNARTALAGNAEMIVLVIRGELLRKYPGTVLYMQKAHWVLDANNNPIVTQPRELDPNASPVYPAFTGKVEPDIFLAGFTVSPSDAKGGEMGDNDHPGYYFIFQEKPGELHFGADETGTSTYPGALAGWDSLTWSYLMADPTTDGFIDTNRNFSVTGSTIGAWNDNAGNMAYALLQAPVRLSVHATGLLP